MEDQCNGACHYCLTHDSRLKQQHQSNREQGKIKFKSYGTDVYAPGSPLYINLQTVIGLSRKAFDAPILLMSGGEIFLTSGIMDFITEMCNLYPVVQVLSNGTMLDETLITRMNGLENLHLSITLDGHTTTLNACRNTDETVQLRILTHIGLLQRLKIKTEIFCVLTRHNLGGIRLFAEYLNQYQYLTLIPFPVRGTAMGEFFPGKDDLRGFLDLLYHYADYERILPPFPYLEALADFLWTPRRHFPCRTPGFTFQMFHDGIVTPCPFGWTQPMANLLEEDPEMIAAKMENDNMLRMMLGERPFLPFCRKCFNHLDLVNLYLQDKVTLPEMARMSLFSAPAVIRRLTELKEQWGKGGEGKHG